MWAQSLPSCATKVYMQGKHCLGWRISSPTGIDSFTSFSAIPMPGECFTVLVQAGSKYRNRISRLCGTGLANTYFMGLSAARVVDRRLLVSEGVSCGTSKPLDRLLRDFPSPSQDVHA